MIGNTVFKRWPRFTPQLQRVDKWLLFLFVLALPLANQDRFYLITPKLFPDRFILILLIGLSLPYFYRKIRERKFPIDNFLLILVGLFIVRVVSLINTLNIASSISLLAFFASVIALYLILKKLVEEDAEYFSFLFKLYLAVVVIIGIFGLLQYLLAIIGIILPGVLKGGNYFRIPSTFYDANHLPPFLSSGIFFFLSFSWLLKRRTLRLLSLIIALLLSALLVLTFSRSGFLGLGAGCFVFFILALKEGFAKNVAPLVVILVVSVCGMILVSNSTHYSLVDRLFNSLTDPAEKSTSAHSLLLQGEWELFKENPILGVGYGSFSEHFRASDFGKKHTWVDPNTDVRLPPHSIWLETLTETGIIGFSVYFAFMALMLKNILAAITRASSSEKIILISFISGIVAMLIGGIFYSYNLLFFWFYIFVGLIYSQVVLSKYAKQR